MIKLSRKQNEEILIKIFEKKIYDTCPICSIICKSEKAYKTHVLKHGPIKLSNAYLEMHRNVLRGLFE